MPQNNLGANVAQSPTGSAVPLKADSAGALLVSGLGGTQSTLNLTAPGAVIKATPGRVVRISVTVAGSAPGTVSDVSVLASVAAANLIATIPNTLGVIQLEFPTLVGLTVVPGTGQTVSVSWS